MSIFAVGAEDGAVGVEDGDDGLEGGADLGRGVFDDDGLSGAGGELEVIEVAGLGDDAGEDGGEMGVKSAGEGVVGFLVRGFADVGFDEEGAFGRGAERGLEAEGDVADFGFRGDFDFDGDLVAGRERADVDGGLGAVGADADVGQVGKLFDAEDFAGDAGIGEEDGGGFGEVEAFDDEFGRHAAGDAAGDDGLHGGGRRAGGLGVERNGEEQGEAAHGELSVRGSDRFGWSRRDGRRGAFCRRARKGDRWASRIDRRRF